MRTLLLAIVVAFSGCATSSNAPSIRYYLLDEAQTQINSTKGGSPIAIAPVFVAEYLSLPNLVLKQADHGIVVANYHFWAEPLPASIKRAFMSDLARLKPNMSVVDRCTNCDLINLYVDHFYPETEGDAVFTGRYSIIRSNGKVENYPFSLRTPLANDGYAEAVQQMRTLITILSQRIAIEL